MKRAIILGSLFGPVLSALVIGYLALNLGEGSATDGTPAFQAGIVADGIVTDAEYQAAAEAMASCLTTRGLPVATPRIGPSGLYEFIYIRGFASPDEIGPARQQYESCYAERLSAVDKLRQLAPEFRESAERRGFWVQRCVESRKPEFAFAQDQAELLRRVAMFDSGGDPDFQACMVELSRSVTEPGLPVARLDIAYHPLPR